MASKQIPPPPPPPPPPSNKFIRGATLQTKLNQPLLANTGTDDNRYSRFAKSLEENNRKTYQSPLKVVPEYTQIIEDETDVISRITNAGVAGRMNSNITAIINTKIEREGLTEADAVDISKKWKIKIDEILEDQPFMMDEDNEEKITREKITKLKFYGRH